MADYVDNHLTEVLTFLCQLEVAGFPCFDNAYKLASVVVGGSADAATRSAHGQTGKDSLVLAVQHIVFTVLVKTALVVLIHALEGVFDSGEVRHAAINSLQQLHHRQISAVKSGDVVVVERQVGSTAGNLLDIFHQLLHAVHLREGGSHGTDAPGADGCSMFGQAAALAHTAAAHMHDDLEALGGSSHPALRQFHALLGSKHIALARRTVDKDALQAVLLQHSSVGGNGFEVHIAVGIKGSKRRINKSDDFFHDSYIFLNSK